MITQNYYNMINSAMLCAYLNVDTRNAIPCKNVTTADGTVYNCTDKSTIYNGVTVPYIYETTSSTIETISSTLRGGYIRVGSGTRAESINDVNLQTDITTSFTNISQTCEVTYDELKKCMVITNTRILYNKQSTALTVSEIGNYRGYYEVNATARQTLIYREVLETPIEVPSHTNVSITTTFELYPPFTDKLPSGVGTVSVE